MTFFGKKVCGDRLDIFSNHKRIFAQCVRIQKDTDIFQPVGASVSKSLKRMKGYRLNTISYQNWFYRLLEDYKK